MSDFDAVLYCHSRVFPTNTRAVSACEPVGRDIRAIETLAYCPVRLPHQAFIYANVFPIFFARTAFSILLAVFAAVLPCLALALIFQRLWGLTYATKETLSDAKAIRGIVLALVGAAVWIALATFTSEHCFTTKCNARSATLYSDPGLSQTSGFSASSEDCTLQLLLSFFMFSSSDTSRRARPITVAGLSQQRQSDAPQRVLGTPSEWQPFDDGAVGLSISKVRGTSASRALASASLMLQTQREKRPQALLGSLLHPSARNDTGGRTSRLPIKMIYSRRHRPGGTRREDGH